MEYKAIRHVEEDDILKCAEENENGKVSDMRKLACMATPVTWSLQDLAKGVVQKPSHCRELYSYQTERCSFLLGCCPQMHSCMSKITSNSLAFQQRLQRSRTISVAVKKCLEGANKRYDNPKKQKMQTDNDVDSVLSLRKSVSEQQKRIEEAILEARAEAALDSDFKDIGFHSPKSDVQHLISPPTTSIITATQTTALPTLPTIPTLPTLPNLLHAENKKLCLEALKCEKKLQEFKLECGKKHIDELKNPISRPTYADLVLLRELLQNLEETGASSAVRKACVHPLLVNHTNSREACLAISTDIIFEEISFENSLKNAAEKVAEKDFDSCLLKIKFAKKKCDEAKNCCPGYHPCKKLVNESQLSHRYNDKLRHIKEQQKKCELETVYKLSSVEPGFLPYFH
ncbi:unnamed protein product [Enterobius vermicularis]|uniref:Inositol-pentakisphosphate 2-kinase n=1 Tax=Enterobius vermicularis TaxID=51028 RepID=A0A0N4VJ08_ENTVE|nr:unnamed protein product [Enterobius vermicularis]